MRSALAAAHHGRARAARSSRDRLLPSEVEGAASAWPQALVAKHGGQVPADMDALTALPGVGRKTANVVLGHALGVPGLPVDRHVLRVANRIGIAQAATPEEVEAQLCAACRASSGRWRPTR